MQYWSSRLVQARLGNRRGVTTYRRRFAATAGAVPDARQFVRECIAGRADGSLSDDVILALSELATNAVLHARTSFDVVVETDGAVRIEVEDGSTDAPVMRDELSADRGGRGLRIVEEVCDRWGVHVVRGRKCVWCERELT